MEYLVQGVAVTLVLVFSLVGSLATNETQGRAGVGRSTDVRGSAVTETRAPNGPFETSPLEWKRPLLQGPFRLAEAPWAGSSAVQEVDGAQNPAARPRLVCTLRVVKASPSIDPGFVVRFPARQRDPIVRDDLSPCVE